MAEDEKNRVVSGSVDPRNPSAVAGAFRPESTFNSPPAEATSSVGLPSLSAPKGGGAVRGIGEKFAASAATGTASLSVPIATSPGRGGFQLGLALGYDSGAGNGPFGLGWNLSVPSISRKTDKGIPRYLDDIESDVFILAGSEDLVPIRTKRSGDANADERVCSEFRVRRYRPRVEGAFTRIERWTDRRTGVSHWRTTNGNNVTSIFGRSVHARICAPDDPKQIYSWLIEETHDDRGNIVRYSYKSEDASGIDRDATAELSRFPDGAFCATAQRYLKRIEYGNERPGDPSRWLFEVVFDYGEHDEAAPTPDQVRLWPARMDAFSTYRPGFEVRTYRLCHRVLMFHRFAELGPAPYLVRSTDFEYEHRGHLSALRRVTHAGYLRDEQTGSYERATLPALELGYTERKVHGEVRSLDAHALDGIPGGVDGASARWVDLDGEGISGVLLAKNRGWYYKSNLGGGMLSSPVLLRSLPVPAALDAGVQQLTDLTGEGRPDLVQFTPPLAGYFERTSDGDWAPFRPFRTLPNIDWRDPNLRFLDLDGDGLADLLITRDDALVWYRSRGKAGFEPPLIISRPKEESQGPAIIFADGTETIQLADMSGDGLVDIVRVRNGEVCYWPNLGYGRFGRKITMDRSPWFSEEDQFDPRRVRLADLDGSGTADVVYLGRAGVGLYFNESGSRLTAPTALSLPLPNSATAVSVVDLLGHGTACLVWSSALPADHGGRLQYVDLMGGQKPHLLARVANSMGGETRVAYASSTAFYLKDKAEGRPWITRLPFPVHVAERVEHFDHIAGTRLVTRYRYHHGFYDGVEREYRGFAYVEQWDAETIGAERDKGLFPDGPDEIEGELRVPPVHTKTWFHTGAWLDRECMEAALAREYYLGDPGAPRLLQPPLPPGLTVAEEREAARALRGRLLRQEIYAEDGVPQSVHPYSVTEHSYNVRLLQREEPEVRGEGHAYAVFYVHPREDLTLNYERCPNDPRTQHQLVLAVDDFGNVLRSAAIAYPRRKPIHPEQQRQWATFSEFTFVNQTDEPTWYRIGVPISSATSELTGLPSGRFLTFNSARSLLAEAAEIPFEQAPSGALERRVISRQRALYYRDDLEGQLPAGQIGARALLCETQNQTFTSGLIARVYGEDVDAALLTTEARYVQADGVWWASSGRAVYDPVAFYQPIGAINAFGARSWVRYDALALLVIETEDPLGNKVTAGRRSATGDSVPDGNDYRVLAAKLLTDANLNRTAVAFDALGMPVWIALMGKEGRAEGDTLDDPTTRIEYDLHRYVATQGAQPVFVHSFMREKHGADNPRWQEAYSYVDGSGREAMRKVQAAPGEVPVRGPNGRIARADSGAIQLRHERHRWIGSGRTIFDNKGNPVKKYEPYFSGTFEFEHDRELVDWGVTPILRYDPLGRLIRTDLPDCTLRRVSFHAWEKETWDQNDTVLESRWYRERGAPDPRGAEPKGDPSRRAAWLAAQHANTPARTHVDSLGRTFLSEVDNKDPGGLYSTRIVCDISGNVIATIDARGNRTLDGQIFDMIDRPLYTRSAEAGWSRVLPDVAGNAIRGWDARGQSMRYRYDERRRPTHVFVRTNDGTEALVARHVYGEAHPEALARNLRNQLYQTYDGAGVTSNARFDFKGNVSQVSRQLDTGYRETVDWSPLADLTSVEAIEAAAASRLESESFTATAEHDALSRVISEVTPDGSNTRRQYNEASLLRHVEVTLRGSASPTTFVESIEYNARGQRTRIVRGNGTLSRYHYDPATFRLMHLTTARERGPLLQDLRYECDAVGNIVQVGDGVSFGNQVVSADGLYAYDPLYRLIRAEGREHPGQQPSFADPANLDLAHPHDFQAIRRYRETYTYDPVGNIEQVAHRPLVASDAGWVRQYEYAEASNRLLRTSGQDDSPTALSERYAYDPHGNMTAMPHLFQLQWDYADRLVSADRQGGGQVYFTYNASSQRVRKVYEHGGSVEERIYFGAYEIYRKRKKGDGRLVVERETLHVMDDAQRVAMVETKTLDEDTVPFAATTRMRYQMDNHLGSSVLELDESAKVISYEEYLPFGATALRAGRNKTEVSEKRYRYTGKERDEETGLYYHGARYYAAWLGRWISCDPAGTSDGLNQYSYVHNNPISAVDPTGKWSTFWTVVAIVAVVAVVAVVTVATLGTGTGPAAAGGAALITAETAATTTAVVATGEVAVATTEVVAATTEVAAATTEVAAATTEVAAATGEVAAATTEVAAAGTTTGSSLLTAAKVAAAPAAATVMSQGPQIAQEAEEVLESAAPAVVNEIQVVSQEIQSLAPRLQSVAPQAQTAVQSLQAPQVQNEVGALAQEAEAAVETGPQLVYRGGSATPANFTPRPGVDTTGLSTFENLEAATPPGGKAQIIDISRLQSLSAVPDAPPPGHVSITPGDPALLEEWAATRGTERVHAYTQELLNAIVDVVKRPK